MFSTETIPTSVAAVQAVLPATHYDYSPGMLVSAGVTSIISKDSNNEVLDTHNIPAEIQSLPGYGWSAATKHNYIDFERKVYVQEVKKCVMDGTQYNVAKWSPDPGNPNGVVFSQTSMPFTRSAQVVCDRFVRSCYGSNTMPLFTFMGGSGVTQTIAFCMPNTVATNDDAKAWFTANPTTIYYSLDTPIETDISEYLPDDILTLAVEAGGTLTFVNSNGDDYRIPVPVNIEMIGVS
jgi:hypothetical protein